MAAHSMPQKLRAILPIVLIILFTILLFRDAVFRGLVPFPANLLVSYYEPWKSYPSPEYPNGPPNKAMGFDNLRIYYPIKKVAVDAVRHFEPPLWNPYNFSGNVLLGTYQSAVFHPLSWLFLILPQIDAWSVVIFLQPILASAAMYCFLTVLGFSVTARVTGALTYGFSGFFLTWWQESYMFTYSSLFHPLTLAAVEMFLKTKRGLWLSLVSLSLAGSIVSGAFQMTFYVFAFTVVWIIHRIWKSPDRIKLGASLLLSGGVSGLLAAVHILPSMEGYRLSTRIATDVKYIFDAYLLPLSRLVTLIAPDYFGNPATYNYFGGGFYHERLVYLGIVPLVFILTQLFRRKFSVRHGRFFQIAFIVSLSLVLSLPTTWFLLYHLKLPLLSTMTPSRMMMIVTFCGAVLSAMALPDYWKGFTQKQLLRVTIVLGFALIAAGAFPVIAHLTDDKNTSWLITVRNLVIPAASLILTVITLWITAANARLRTAGFSLIILIMLGNIFLFSKKYLYFSERRFLYPAVTVFDELKKRSAFDRFWTYENGYVEKNFASYYGIFSPEGYDSIMIRRYAEFLAYANSRGATVLPDRANALIQSTDHLDDILADSYRKRALELLGVRYVIRKLVPDKNRQAVAKDPAALPRVWDDGTYAIHEYRGALPRAFLSTDIRVIPKDRDLLYALFHPDTDIGKTIFLEENPPFGIRSAEATGSAAIVAVTPNRVTVKTAAADEAMLFLSDAYYPGWIAAIDGKKTRVFRADYAFRAVPVPKGIHTVEFRYEPFSWKAGLAGSTIGILGIIGFIARDALDRKRRT